MLTQNKVGPNHANCFMVALSGLIDQYSEIKENRVKCNGCCPNDCYLRLYTDTLK